MEKDNVSAPIKTMGEELKILRLFEVVKANTYKCELCKEIIFPNIVTAGEGHFDVMTNVTSIHGGIGNDVIHRKVCSKCSAELTVIKE